MRTAFAETTGVKRRSLWRIRRKSAILVAIGGSLAAGLLADGSGSAHLAALLWMVGTGIALAALALEIVTKLRQREIGLDIVAALSMSAALAFGVPLAGNVVGLMYAGGQFLESLGSPSCSARDDRAPPTRVPQSAIRDVDGTLQSVAIGKVAPGDRLLVRQGDVIPVDGIVASGVALLDQSALTGESVPVRRARGDMVMSGSTNSGAAFDLATTHDAADSTYARIARLVEAAQQAKAPMSRLADRFSIYFLGVALMIAAGAYVATGEEVRLLAVLVIATPCPLILAVPVALMPGLRVQRATASL